MKYSICLFLALFSFVNCGEAPNFNLGPTHFELKKNAGLEETQPELPELKSNVIGKNFVADNLKALIESFRDDVPDPIVIDRIGPLEYSATGTRVTGNIRNLQITGQTWYVVDYVTFSPLRLALGLHVTVPWVNVTGTYNARARLLLIVHTAGGNFRVFVNRVEVGVDLRLGTNILGGHLTLRELDVRVDIADTNIRIDGLVGSNILNGIINSIIQTKTRDFIQNGLEDISKQISEQLFDVINEILKGFTLEHIFG